VLHNFRLFIFFYRKKVKEVLGGVGVSHFLGPLASVKANLGEV